MALEVCSELPSVCNDLHDGDKRSRQSEGQHTQPEVSKALILKAGGQLYRRQESAEAHGINEGQQVCLVASKAVGHRNLAVKSPLEKETGNSCGKREGKADQGSLRAFGNEIFLYQGEKFNYSCHGPKIGMYEDDKKA